MTNVSSIKSVTHGSVCAVKGGDNSTYMNIYDRAMFHGIILGHNVLWHIELASILIQPMICNPIAQQLTSQ